MSLKTIRVFALTAVILLAASVAAEVIFGLSWSCFVRLIAPLYTLTLSVVFMVFTRSLRSDRASKVAVIILGALILLTPLLNWADSILYSVWISRWDYDADTSRTLGETLSAYGYVSGFINLLLSYPALVLMLLSMGGFFGRAGELRANPQEARPAVSAETAPEAEPAHEPEPMPPTDRDKPTEQNEEKEGTLL